MASRKPTFREHASLPYHHSIVGTNWLCTRGRCDAVAVVGCSCGEARCRKHQPRVRRGEVMASRKPRKKPVCRCGHAWSGHGFTYGWRFLICWSCPCPSYRPRRRRAKGQVSTSNKSTLKLSVARRGHANPARPASSLAAGANAGSNDFRRQPTYRRCFGRLRALVARLSKAQGRAWGLL